MKKHLQPLRLLLALFLMFCVLKSYAQTDVTSTYLTNADFNSTPITWTTTNQASASPGTTAVSGTAGFNVTGWTALNSGVGGYSRFSTANYGITFVTKPDVINSVNPPASEKGGGTTGASVMMSGSWGSTVILTQNVTLPAGNYRLDYDIINQNGTVGIASNRFGFVPNSGTTTFYGTKTTFANSWNTESVSFTLKEQTAGKISIGLIGINTGSAGNGKLAIDNVKLFYSVDKSVLSDRLTFAQTNYGSGTGVGAASLNSAISTAQVTNNNSSATQAEVNTAVTDLQTAINNYLILNATIASPVELSSYILNASFENAYSLLYWTNTNSMARQNNTPGNNWTKDGTYYAEKWIASGSNLPAASLSQSLTNLPNGKYYMTLSGHAIQQSNAALVTTGAFAFAGVVSKAINTGGNYTVENIVVTDGSLNIGYKIEAPITCNWTGFDNFKLYYQGPVMDPVITAPITNASFTTATNTATIDITGANLTSDITISVPSTTISLSGTNITGTSPNYTIALANANATNSITATWDKAANVSGNITFTSGSATKNIAVSSSDVETVSISGFNTSSGILNPTFDVNTTTYSIKTPVSGTTISAVKTPADATVSNSGTTLSSSNTSIVMTGSSYNGNATTSSYTFNWDSNYSFDDWDANGDVSSTAVSLPSTYGWQCINTTDNTVENVWNNFGTQSNCRYRDTNTGYTYNGADKSNVRIMFIRWDAGGTTNRVFSYPVYLETGTNYQINGKIAWNSNGSAPIVNFKINSAANNGGTNYATSNITTGSSGALKDINLRNISVPTTGVYYFTISANTASLCAISDLQINTQDSFTADGDNTWSTKSWTQGRAPKSGDHLTVSNGTLVIDDFINLNTITVAPGAKVTINTGKSVDALTVNIQSNENGTGTILNNGNTNITNANIQQYLTTKSASDKTDNWWYISSPVSNATSAVILTEGSGNKFGYYNEATATYPQITATDATLTAGKGYVAQINTTGTYTFSGSLNNGDVPVTLTRTGNTELKRGFNLVGNPYLSFLNWNDVKGARTDIRSTVWFRTRTAAGAMTFDTYNGLTGTSLGKNGEVTQHIPPMQAFWVKVHEDATSGDPLVNTINLTLTNNMRSHQDQTLTTNRLRTPEADDKQIIRINVTNGTNKDETILMSYSGAQDLMDTYDSEKISNNNVAIPEIYTLLNNEEITINTMNSLPLNIELPLGFRTGQAGNFTISTSELTNLGSDVKLILKDKQTSTETEMTVDNSYNFASDAVNTDDRFTVILKATGVTTDVHQLKNALLVYGNTNNQIVVSGLIAEGTPVHIFNAVGQQIYQGDLNGSYNVINQKLQQGVYLVKINQTIQKVTLK